jgi:hypothetical protein
MLFSSAFTFASALFSSAFAFASALFSSAFAFASAFFFMAHSVVAYGGLPLLLGSIGEIHSCSIPECTGETHSSFSSTK